MKSWKVSLFSPFHAKRQDQGHNAYNSAEVNLHTLLLFWLSLQVSFTPVPCAGSLFPSDTDGHCSAALPHRQKLGAHLICTCRVEWLACFIRIEVGNERSTRTISIWHRWGKRGKLRSRQCRIDGMSVAQNACAPESKVLLQFTMDNPGREPAVERSSCTEMRSNEERERHDKGWGRGWGRGWIVSLESR